MSAPAGPGASESGDPTAPTAEGTRLVLARHGETDHNRQRRMQGRTDIPLNAQGREQARALARSLADAAHGRPDVIAASPLQRAAETARIIGQELGLDVALEEDLVERGFGRWEGLTGEEIRERWPREQEDWRHRRSVAGIGMESRVEVAERMGGAARRVLVAHPGQTVLLVGHGAAITLAISDLLGLDPEEFRGISGLENCHRSVLDPLLADPEGRLMRLVSHNLRPDFLR